MGEKVTYTIRLELFSETLHKQISWFDRQERAPGVITSVFSENMEALRGMTTETLVKYFESIFTFIIGLIAGIIFCPEQTLVLVTLSPIMVGSMLCWSRLQWKKNEKGTETTLDSITDSYEKSNALLSDLILNYRTVISFGQTNIKQINRKFSDLLVPPLEAKIKESR